MNIIVILKDNKPIATYGGIKEICEVFNLPYHSLKAKKFPFSYDEYTFYKLPFRAVGRDK